MELEDTDVGEFELLESSSGMSLEELRKPVTLKEWNGFFDPRTGRLNITVDEVKERIFHGGLDPDDGVRKEAWLFLLGIYDWYSTAPERKAQLASLRDEYVKLKAAWWERLVDLGGQGDEGEWWREQRSRIGTYNDHGSKSWWANLLKQRKMFTEQTAMYRSLLEKTSLTQILIHPSQKAAPTYTWSR